MSFKNPFVCTPVLGYIGRKATRELFHLPRPLPAMDLAHVQGINARKRP